MKMKRIAGIVVAFAVFFALLSTARAEHYEVFIIAGQSNCDGRGQAKDLTGDLAPFALPQKDILIAYSCSTLRGPALNSGGFKPLQPGWSVAPGKNKPKSVPSPTFGPEVGFGRALADGMPGKHVALIKFSEGGTSLKKDWNPDIRGRLYDACIAFTTQSLKDLQAQGNTCTLRGIIWHQGESDASLSADEYQKLLTGFIGHLRADLGAADLPFGIGEVFDDGKRDNIRAAEKATATAVAHAFFVPSTGLKTSDNGTHFDAASQIEIGKRFAAEMLKTTGAR